MDYYIITDLTDRVVGLACGPHVLEVERYFEDRLGPVQVLHATDVEDLRTTWNYCAHCGENVR